MTASSSTGEALLALRGLTVSYQTSEGPLTAVRGVDLSVDAGEVLGIAASPAAASRRS